MSQIPAATTNPPTSTTSSTSSGVGNVDISQFLSLMVSELQNQDPLSPTSSSDFMQQISTIQQIGSTNQLTTSLDSLNLGQNVGIASSLIGKNVTALDANGNNIQGVVQSASIAVSSTDSSQRSVQVSINGTNIDVSNIRGISD